MNERIRRLMEQAKAESSQWLGSKPAITITYDELEKFAELIVRECVKQAHGVADLRGVNEDMVYGADTAAIRIHRYFGVEE